MYFLFLKKKMREIRFEDNCSHIHLVIVMKTKISSYNNNTTSSEERTYDAFGNTTQERLKTYSATA